MNTNQSNQSNRTEQNPFEQSQPESLERSGNKATYSVEDNEEYEPFRIVKKVEEDGNESYFCGIANFQVSNTKGSKEECAEMIKEKDWELIIGLISVMNILKGEK